MNFDVTFRFFCRWFDSHPFAISHYYDFILNVRGAIMIVGRMSHKSFQERFSFSLSYYKNFLVHTFLFSIARLKNEIYTQQRLSLAEMNS